VIDNFVLSCRVFSRNVEDTIVGLILRAAQARGAPAVMARFVETAKNRKFAGFYKSLGFVDLDGDGVRFRREFHQLTELPRWFRIIAGTEVFDAF
jgi:predicted enzyme involved in methoxymalonyl-ACP biosynthesis